MGRLAGKTAIITGGARGQGEAEVRRFVAEGANVVIGDLLDEPGEKLAAELGDAATYLHMDVSQESSWADAVAAAEAFGPLNVLVNNAAIHWTRPIAHETAEGFEKMWRVNALGPFLGMKAVLEPMRRAGGGSIVNISSTAGMTGYAYHGAYGHTKWALRGLTKVAAVEFGEAGIRVNSVHPGPIKTGMLPGFQDPEVDERFSHTARPARRRAVRGRVARPVPRQRRERVHHRRRARHRRRLHHRSAHPVRVGSRDPRPEGFVTCPSRASTTSRSPSPTSTPRSTSTATCSARTLLHEDLWRAGKMPVALVSIGANRLSMHPAAAPAKPHALAPTPGSADLCFRWEGTIADAIALLEANGVVVEEGPVPAARQQRRARRVRLLPRPRRQPAGAPDAHPVRGLVIRAHTRVRGCAGRTSRPPVTRAPDHHSGNLCAPSVLRRSAGRGRVAPK